MKSTSLVLLALLVVQVTAAQQSRLPVYVSETGKDRIGSLFAVAFSQELSHSTRYRPMPPEEKSDGTRFYVDLVTVDMANDGEERVKKSAVSVVIEVMGLPNSFPVPSKWYHKVFIVDQQTTDKMAKELLEDMDAGWCNTIKDSVGGCPKEKLYPTN